MAVETFFWQYFSWPICLLLPYSHLWGKLIPSCFQTHIPLLVHAQHALYFWVLQHRASHILWKAWGINVVSSSDETHLTSGSLSFLSYSRIRFWKETVASEADASLQPKQTMLLHCRRTFDIHQLFRYGVKIQKAVYNCYLISRTIFGKWPPGFSLWTKAESASVCGVVSNSVLNVHFASRLNLFCTVTGCHMERPSLHIRDGFTEVGSWAYSCALTPPPQR